jgi:SOS-response transcriptional repressor LexA
MTDAGVLDGDGAVIRPTSGVHNGAGAAAQVHDAATPQRLYRESFRDGLQPENPACEPTAGTREHRRILGRLVRLSRSW